MKKRFRLGIACKIVAVVRFGFGVLSCVGNMLVIIFQYKPVWTEAMALLGLSLPRQILNDLVPGLILWGIGTLLDRQQQDRRELERIAKRLDGEEENAPETEADTLEGFIPLDDLAGLDQPVQEP